MHALMSSSVKLEATACTATASIRLWATIALSNSIEDTFSPGVARRPSSGRQSRCSRPHPFGRGLRCGATGCATLLPSPFPCASNPRRGRTARVGGKLLHQFPCGYRSIEFIHHLDIDIGQSTSEGRPLTDSTEIGSVAGCIPSARSVRRTLEHRTASQGHPASQPHRERATFSRLVILVPR